MSNVNEINATDFKTQVIEHNGLVLVDFFAQWCGPCKMIAPIIDEIATEFSTLKVVKVDADKAQALMLQFGIRGIPTLLLFNEGKVVATKVGALSLTQLREFINANS
ncbi:thioredoxin [Psychromonas marina]|uniref:Thioredoxin n=2 Tax=Psychromonas marina TaxID=88364 RepID=A0ABQ6E2D4_9GAMM|nr:thioredoxin [Psychromonas marina]GLS91404.1 thioredoxin [Psychromonas marina]